jgi:uncharacterized protein YceK
MRFNVCVCVALVAGCATVTTTISPSEMTDTSITETRVRIAMYVEQNGNVPASLEVLPIRDGYANRTTDGWNRALVFRTGGDEFSLGSLGRDGVVGGTGEDVDVLQKFRVVGKEVVEAE